MDPQTLTVAVSAVVALTVLAGGKALGLMIGGKGGSGAQSQADSRGVNVEIGERGAGGRDTCSVEVQTTLRQLADVQAAQQRLRERMAEESKWARRALLELATERIASGDRLRLPPYEG